MCRQLLLGNSFAMWSLLTGFFGGLFRNLVVLDTVKEIKTAGAVFDVFHTNGDALGQNAAPHSLVNDDTKGMFGNVENTTSLAMVRLVGHTLLEGTVSFQQSSFTLLTPLAFLVSIPFFNTTRNLKF